MDRNMNPFAPGAGTNPPELVGRQDVLEKVQALLHRVKAGRFEKGLIITGLRGVGKTVLLNKVLELANIAGYRSLDIEVSGQEPFVQTLGLGLRSVLLGLSHKEKIEQEIGRGLGVLKNLLSGLNIKVSDVEFGMNAPSVPGVADSGTLTTDLPDFLETIGNIAKQKGTGVAILVDEMQDMDKTSLTALIMGMHRIQRRSLPVIFIGAGLPMTPGLMGDARTYVERLFDFMNLGPLNQIHSAEAIEIPLKRVGVPIEREALTEIYHETLGYPYFLQEWGYVVWNEEHGSKITQSTVQRSASLAIKKLDQSFFTVRLGRLTDTEKGYLQAMALYENGECRSGTVAKNMGRKSVGQLSQVRDSLIDKGMVYSPKFGFVAFTVPQFEIFIRRNLPAEPEEETGRKNRRR